MSLSLILEPLTADLLPEAIALDHACFGGLWNSDGYQREIDSPNSDLLIIRPSPTPVLPHSPTPPLLALGCAWAIVEEAHITLLGVHPDYRGQGLGQVMLYSLLALARQRGLERATLEVRVSNQPALALYGKFGFREAGRRRRYYQDNGEDAAILWVNGLHQPEFQQSLTNWRSHLNGLLNQCGLHLTLPE